MLYMQFHISMMQEILFNCGAVKNTADNAVNIGDQIVFHIESFVSNDAFPRTVCSHKTVLQSTILHVILILVVLTVHPTSSTR